MFYIELPSRFNRQTPVIILGKQRIGDMEHYRVVSAEPMYNRYTNVSSAAMNSPFSIILKSGDEDAIRGVFKYWNEDGWKTLVHYGKRGYDDWSDIFEYIFEMKRMNERTEMTDRKELITLLETMEELREDKGNKELGRHQNNKLASIESKLINPSELKKGGRYLIETVHEGRIGSIDIAIIKNVSTNNSGKTTITYRVKDGLPFGQTITVNSTGNSESGGSVYFYKRPTIAEAIKDINISPGRMGLIAFRQREVRNLPGGTGRPLEFPRREGPPKPPKANENASKEPQTGGKRKTRHRRGRRVAKKSRKQRKN
jgi:hypothetical protein